MQKISTQGDTYSYQDIKDTLKEVENKFTDKNNPVNISVVTPLLSCCLYINKEKFILLVSSLIHIILKYTTDSRIKISYRLITGKQFIFYIQNTGIRLMEEQRAIFIKECNREIEDNKIIIDKMGGSIGVEFTTEKNITFWFTISITPIHS